MVDLDATSNMEHVIDQVTIYTLHMYKSYKVNVQLQILDDDMNLVAFKSFPFNPMYSTLIFEFDPPVMGRFVRVQAIEFNHHLFLAEVEVSSQGTTTTTTTTVPSQMCPPPFDRPEGLQPDAQATLAAALEALHLHMISGPSSPPILNQTQIITATNDVVASAHQLTATYDLMEQALSLVEAYEGAGGYGLPVSYGPPVLDGNQFSREQGTQDGRELDRSMMSIQQVILDQMFHANLLGENGVPRYGSSETIDWVYKPVVKECQELFRGRKFWAAKYIPGIVDPPSDPSVVHTELVKANFPPHWGRPVAFSVQKRAIYPIGGLYLSPGGVAAITVPQEIVDHGGYYIQVGSHSVDCGKPGRGWTRQDRMTTGFPVDEATTYVANPFGGESLLVCDAHPNKASNKVFPFPRNPFSTRRVVHQATIWIYD